MDVPCRGKRVPLAKGMDTNLNKPTESATVPEILTAEEAAHYVRMSRRQWDRIYPRLGVPPIRLSDRGIRFRRRDIDAVVARLAEGGAA